MSDIDYRRNIANLIHLSGIVSISRARTQRALNSKPLDTADIVIALGKAWKRRNRR
jgi:hypothetical protein